MVNRKKNPEPVNHELWRGDGPGKKIDTAGASNIPQAVWREWKLYTGTPDYPDEPPPDRVRLDDYNVYMAIRKMQGNERGAAWPADFDRQGDIRALRANYGNEAVMMNNAGEDCYAVFKGYYQLCGEEGREAGVKTRYGTHQTGGGDSLRPGDKVIHLNPQPAPKPKKTAKGSKAGTSTTKAGPSNQAGSSRQNTNMAPSTGTASSPPANPAPSTVIASSPTPNLATKPVFNFSTQSTLSPKPALQGPIAFNTTASSTEIATSPQAAISSNASTPLTIPHTPKRKADEAGLDVPLTDKQRLMNLLASRPAAAPIKPQPLPAAILITDVPLLQAIVRKLLDSSARLGARLNEQTEAVAEIRNYIAEVEDRIVVLKGKLGTVEDYAAGTQSTLAEVIDIPGSIVEYLRENGRTADAEAVEAAEDGWIAPDVENERTLVKRKGKDEEME